jgi:hypothetical protein
VVHANPNTPFEVTSTTFSDIREHDNDELEEMKESLLKNLDFLVLCCWYTEEMPTIGSHGGLSMLSIDQGNPSLRSDAVGQRWYICTWWSNRYKLNMRLNEFKEHNVTVIQPGQNPVDDDSCPLFNPP